MRGIVLAGGTGSRLHPITRVVNKHCLPVNGQPMVYGAVKLLLANGCADITIVSTRSGVGQLAELLGADFTYRVQDKPDGVAGALLCAERRGMMESVLVVLGDNVFNPTPIVHGPAPVCYLYRTRNLGGFGVARFEDARLVSIVEKPDVPPSEYACVGLYLLPSDCFELVRRQTPSARGELEITDLLNQYAVRGLLNYEVLGGFWGDAGTFEGIKACESW
jgi:glucose-1-phosphate thymidylyltransferase